MGKTSYCLAADGHLDFHTDDEAAVFTDYPLKKLADGIDADGIWHGDVGDIAISFMLVPVPGGGWKAIFWPTPETRRPGILF